jgi:cystathionine beta-synthase
VRLTVDQILAARRREDLVIGVSPDITLAEAIQTMIQHSISQVPVLDGGEVVGSLSERGVLNRLMTEPASRERPVREVMAAPLPVVGRDVHLDRLTAYLEGESSAVLVRDEAGGDGAAPAAFHIVTRSDLISAIAQAGRG